MECIKVIIDSGLMQKKQQDITWTKMFTTMSDALWRH